jgi:flagellar assembly protein FliH
MTSRVIPKEHLTAYQRWELLGIEDTSGTFGKRAQMPPEETHAINLPTAEDLEQIHQQSAQEGFKIGHEEGYTAGFEMGRQAGQASAERFANLVESLDAELLRQDEKLSRELLSLALAVAKQMLRTALKVKEGLVLEVLREAMNSLPGLSGHLRVMAHPDDLHVISEFLAAEHDHFSAKAVADSRVERGGFRIESSNSEVDGELPIRWQEIVDCLGTDSAWLE